MVRTAEKEYAFRVTFSPLNIWNLCKNTRKIQIQIILVLYQFSRNWRPKTVLWPLVTLSSHMYEYILNGLSQIYHCIVKIHIASVCNHFLVARGTFVRWESLGTDFGFVCCLTKACESSFFLKCRIRNRKIHYGWGVSTGLWRSCLNNGWFWWWRVEVGNCMSTFCN